MTPRIHVVPNARGFVVDEARKQVLIQRLRRGDAIFRFDEDPALASLCTCLGLQFELGRLGFDRLSPFFGVPLDPGSANPWRSEIFSTASEIGIRFWPQDGRPLKAHHPDFAYILHPSSFDAQGNLSQIVIFPYQVAIAFQKKGFHLVIVSDWVLSSSLAIDAKKCVPYLFANEWEIKNLIAATQIHLMKRHKLAFSGTHDIVDHLLGADFVKFSSCLPLVEQAQEVFDRVFNKASPPTPRQLILAYLVGILLDDLAQARWYGSEKHLFLIRQALDAISRTDHSPWREWAPPSSFHVLVEELRSASSAPEDLQRPFRRLLKDLETPR